MATKCKRPGSRGNGCPGPERNSTTPMLPHLDHAHNIANRLAALAGAMDLILTDPTHCRRSSR